MIKNSKGTKRQSGKIFAWVLILSSTLAVVMACGPAKLYQPGTLRAEQVVTLKATNQEPLPFPGYFVGYSVFAKKIDGQHIYGWHLRDVELGFGTHILEPRYDFNPLLDVGLGVGTTTILGCPIHFDAESGHVYKLDGDGTSFSSNGRVKFWLTDLSNQKVIARSEAMPPYIVRAGPMARGGRVLMIRKTVCE